VLDRRQGERLRVGWRQGGGSEGRIFGFDPAEKLPAFIGVWRDQTYPARRRQKRNSRRINDLKKVKAESVQSERGKNESAQSPFAAAGSFPAEN